MRALLLSLPLLLAALPASAQWHQAMNNGPPSPCDHYIPTGEPLPRQDTITMGRALYSEPTWRGKRTGNTVSGDKVTVLQECGLWVRIRTSDAQEGWLSIRILPHELALQRQAERRPPATPHDCEVRYQVPSLVESCEQGVTQRQARADELAHSVTLTGAAVGAAASGKTFEVVKRNVMTGDRENDAPPLLVYFDPHGESFSMIEGESPTRMRGRWVVEADKLCVPTAGGIACGAVRHTLSGATVWAMNAANEYLAKASDGDPGGLARQVKEVFPYPAPPHVPHGLAGLAHPVMGW